MDTDDIKKLRVGAFVIIALCCLGILIVANYSGNFLIGRYEVTVKPLTAPGVTKGTPVRRNGVLIGRVQTVQPEDDYVLLELSIEEDDKIYANEIVSIGADSFLGDSVVEILPKPKEERGDLIKSGDHMSFVSVKRNPMEIVDVALNLETEISETLQAVREAGTAVNEAGAGIRDLTQSVQNTLGDDNGEFKKLLADFRGVSGKAQKALDNFNRIFENVNDFVNDEETKKQFKATIAMLPEIFEEVQITIGDTRETINSFRKVSEGAEDNLVNLKTFTASLSSEGPEILQQVNSSLKNVDKLIAQINEVAKTFSNFKFDPNKGTLGKLMNDTEVYDGVLETVTNVRELSYKLEPLVNDLRTLADSLARDPRQLGIRGAMDQRPLGTGYKGSTTGRDRVLRR